jgi:hypothetical protein
VRCYADMADGTRRILFRPRRNAYRSGMAGKPDFDETTQRRWPDEETGPWLLTIYWARRNGRPFPVGMQLVPDGMEAAGEVTLMTSTLRDLRIAEIVIEDREQLKHQPEPQPPADLRIAGMRESTVRRLQRTAGIYVAAWQAGEPPTQTVARRMNLTQAAAANLVRRAREAGFLPPTSAGVPQG